MPAKDRLGKCGARVLLAVLLLGVAGVGFRWLFLVPIYQAPDEPAHLDYALAIRHYRGLFRVSGPSRSRLLLVHPFTLYLLDRTAEQTIPFQPDARMPPGYGLFPFFGELDADCPAEDPFPCDESPGLAWVYPFGYYVLLAGWIHLLTCWKSSLVWIFFGARAFSVLLLMTSLLCSFGAARELRCGRMFSLLLTAVIGFLPLTMFVSAYVQPDNLSFTLVSLCFYLTLRARRGRHLGVVGLLGLALSALLVTKVHYFLCTALPAGALLAADLWRPGADRRRWAALTGLLVLPSVLSGSVYLWTIWDAQTYYRPADGDPTATSFALGLLKSVKDYYWGTSHRSFWGVFGWMDTPLVLHDEATSMVVRLLLRLGTGFVLFLTLVRLKQVLAVVIRLLRRGKRRWAVGLLVSHPPLNSFFLFTVFMVFLYAHLDNRFGAQGRNWLPFLLPVFLTGLSYAPKALRRHQHRRLLSGGMAAGLVLYALAGNYYGLQTIRDRYYHPQNERPMCRCEVLPRPEPASPTWEQEPGDPSFPWITLGKAQFVYAVRIHYVLTDPGVNPVSFQVFWTNTERPTTVPGRRRLTMDWLPTPVEKTLAVWVNDSIDRLGVIREGTAGRFKVRKMVLFGKPETPSVSRPSPLQ